MGNIFKIKQLIASRLLHNLAVFFCRKSSLCYRPERFMEQPARIKFFMDLPCCLLQSSIKEGKNLNLSITSCSLDGEGMLENNILKEQLRIRYFTLITCIIEYSLNCIFNWLYKPQFKVVFCGCILEFYPCRWSILICEFILFN